MESLEYTLQKFDPGVVLLDANHRVVAMNQVAQRVLGNIRGNPIGHDVLEFHPEKSRAKLELLLRSSRGDQRSPADSPPMTMMINIPDRVLLIKVTSLSDGAQHHSTCMMFYDLTDITTEARGSRREERPKQLVKVPVLRLNHVILLSMSDVVHLRAEGHYTRIFTFDQDYFCNLSLSDLELRLNPQQFMRTHRSHIVNLDRVHTIEREEEQYRVVLDTKDKARVPISRNRADKVRDYFGLV